VTTLSGTYYKRGIRPPLPSNSFEGQRLLGLLLSPSREALKLVANLVYLQHGGLLCHHPWSVVDFKYAHHNTYQCSDLSLDARIKYVSDSVEDILGYLPHEVKGRSCWEYFHPDEIPFARAVHGRGINLDKAASLNYCQIKHKNGSWVGCECVFTVVCDVLVACTSIYRRGLRSQSQYPFSDAYSMGLMGVQSVHLTRRLFEGSFLHLPETRGITCCLTCLTSSLRSKRRILMSHERHCS
jgi:hypothetical protein